jgi:mannose-6-phosphate isomerase
VTSAALSGAPLAPFRLSPWFSPRPWGSRTLLPWFDRVVAENEEPIGEAWLTGPDCVVETGAHRGTTLAVLTQQHPVEMLGAFAESSSAKQSADYPLLLKLIFPQDKLSVQVHPDDELARASGHPRGKTECWYVLEAAPGATLGVGLRKGVTREAVRDGIANGTLEKLIKHLPVSAGDMIFVDPGTVHAIGPGVVLLETQQQSDLTYRMYDYGRKRELHVVQAVAATRLETKAGKVRPKQMESHGGLRARLIDHHYFSVDRYDVRCGETVELEPADVPRTLVGLAGDATVKAMGRGNAAIELVRAHAVVLPPSATGYKLTARKDSVVICATPGEE